MGIAANPPPQSRLPDKLAEDDNLRFYFTTLQEDMYRLWLRSGGGTDQVSEVTDRVESAQGNNQAQLNEISNRLGSGDALTSDETGFTVDSTTLTVDMAEA
jgi:hypothetical protein